MASVSAEADSCAALTEQVRKEQGYAPGLPDCRAYEQASVEKNGIDAFGEAGTVQASPSGNAINFFSVAPFVNAKGAKGLTQSQLSLRSSAPDAWSTVGLLPLANPSAEITHIEGLTEDLTRTIISTKEPILAEGAVLGPHIINAYVRNNALNTYQLLAPDVERPLHFADATPSDSGTPTRILFETETQLATTNVAPAGGSNNLYEWDESKPVGERVSLAGVLPTDKAPEKGSVAGPGGPAIQPMEPGGSTSGFYTQNTISQDGSRVFFTDFATGIIYMREPEGEKTIQISTGTEPGFWRAATPDGNYVFYTEGEELYRFNVKAFEESKEPEALAEAREQITSGAEGVRGMLGVSDHGTEAYFVAPGVLAGNEREYENAKKEIAIEKAEKGRDNLYRWREGMPPTFIVGLQGGEDQDERNWLGNYNSSTAAGASGGEKSSRVTPDGEQVIFSSVSSLTGNASVPVCELKAHSCYEFYLYNAAQPLSSSNPVCISCNPQDVTATSNAFLSRESSTLPIGGPKGDRNAFITHNLADSGGRVFFETREALLPGDVNAQSDVYEWEREGEGSCRNTGMSFSKASGGCVYLISTGQSGRESYFGDASVHGGDVFFFTDQSLVSQDQDNNMDVYDARVEGGILAQNPVAPIPCVDESSCRASLEVPPTFGMPSSLSLSGSGNLGAPAAITVTKKKPNKCLKGKRRKRGKCVKTKIKSGKKSRGKKASDKRRGK